MMMALLLLLLLLMVMMMMTMEKVGKKGNDDPMNGMEGEHNCLRLISKRE